MLIGALKRVLALTTVMVAPFMLAQTAQAHDWNGFYIGANVGLADGSGETSFTPLPDATSFADLRPTSLDPEPRGVIYGLQGGWSFDLGRFVLGVEGDYQSADITGDTRVSPITRNNGTLFPGAGFLRAAHAVDALATLRARAGFELTDNTLVYGTAGVAWGDVTYQATSDFRPGGTNFYTANFSEQQTGWTAGGGVELSLGGGHWSVKTEYLYYDLGDESAVVDAAPVPGGFQVGYEWETTGHALRLGVNYQF